METRDEFCKRCILLKSVDDTVQEADVYTSLSKCGINAIRFHKYTEYANDDVRWIVLLQSETAAVNCIHSNSLTVTTNEKETYNVIVSYCPECIVPHDWIEEEATSTHHDYSSENKHITENHDTISIGFSLHDGQNLQNFTSNSDDFPVQPELKSIYCEKSKENNEDSDGHLIAGHPDITTSDDAKCHGDSRKRHEGSCIHEKAGFNFGNDNFITSLDSFSMIDQERQGDSLKCDGNHSNTSKGNNSLNHGNRNSDKLSSAENLWTCTGEGESRDTSNKWTGNVSKTLLSSMAPESMKDDKPKADNSFNLELKEEAANSSEESKYKGDNSLNSENEDGLEEMASGFECEHFPTSLHISPDMSLDKNFKVQSSSKPELVLAVPRSESCDETEINEINDTDIQEMVSVDDTDIQEMVSVDDTDIQEMVSVDDTDIQEMVSVDVTDIDKQKEHSRLNDGEAAHQAGQSLVFKQVHKMGSDLGLEETKTEDDIEKYLNISPKKQKIESAEVTDCLTGIEYETDDFYVNISEKQKDCVSELPPLLPKPEKSCYLKLDDIGDNPEGKVSTTLSSSENGEVPKVSESFDFVETQDTCKPADTKEPSQKCSNPQIDQHAGIKQTSALDHGHQNRQQIMPPFWHQQLPHGNSGWNQNPPSAGWQWPMPNAMPPFYRMPAHAQMHPGYIPAVMPNWPGQFQYPASPAWQGYWPQGQSLSQNADYKSFDISGQTNSNQKLSQEKLQQPDMCRGFDPGNHQVYHSPKYQTSQVLSSAAVQQTEQGTTTSDTYQQFGCKQSYSPDQKYCTDVPHSKPCGLNPGETPTTPPQQCRDDATNVDKNRCPTSVVPTAPMKSQQVADVSDVCVETQMQNTEKVVGDGHLGNQAKHDGNPKETPRQQHAKQDVDNKSCGIQVTVSCDISQDTLENYFENTRRSGGGDIKEIEYCPVTKQAYIEFHDHKVVDRVISKGSHIIDGETLHVSRCLQNTDRVMDKNRILITGLNPSTNKECLFDFLEISSGGPVPVDLLFGDKPGKAVVVFDKELDIFGLKEFCKRKPLDGHQLHISQVPVTRSIQISNIDGCMSEDELRYYFENRKRSCGGEVEAINLFQDLGVCVISFINSDDVRSVCNKKHVLRGRELNVTKFYACLGLKGGTKKQVQQKIPDPITMSRIDPGIIEFVRKSKVYKNSLEKELFKNHAKVEWPRKEDSDTITFVCMVNETDTHAAQKMESWSENVLKAVKHFIGVMTAKYLPVAKESWDNVLHSLGTISIKHPDGVSIILRQKETTLVVVGHKRIVAELLPEVENILSKEKLRLQQTQDDVSMVTVSEKLKPFQVQILCRNSFCENVEKCVTVKLEKDSECIVFRGNISDIEKVKLAMHEMLNTFVSKRIMLSFGMKKLLSKSEVYSLIDKEMEENGIMGVWDIHMETNDLDFYAKSILDAERGIKIIKACVLEKAVEMKEMLGKYMQTTRWEKTKESLLKLHHGHALIEPENRSIVVTATKDVFDIIYQKLQGEVKDYIEVNNTVNVPLLTKEGVFQYLERYKSIDVQNITHPLIQKYHITVSPLRGPANFGYNIKGTKNGVDIARSCFEKLISVIQTEDWVFPKQGAKEYFASSKGQRCLKQIEEESRCIINTNKTSMKTRKLDSKTRDFHKKGDAMTVSEPVLIAQCMQDELRSIRVMEGDMTKLKVDAIVNAANENMEHCGGIAYAIAKAGGQSIQDECTKYVKTHGSVSDGGAILSGAGRLPCKKIIHAVGPVWKNGKQEEEEHLKKAVTNSLKLASEKQLSSIAFPAISAGIFGYPLDLSTSTMVAAIKEYFCNEDKDSSITIVYFCDTDTAAVTACMTALIKTYGRDEVKVIEGDRHPDLQDISYICSESEDSSSEGEEADSSCHSDIETNDLEASGGSEISSQETDFHGKFNSSRSSRRNIVKISKGELADQKVDVIVNSAQPNLDLKAGILSRSLLKQAGNSIQDECRQNYPNGIECGEIAVTKGGNLSCSYVYHGTIKRWDGTTGEAVRTLEKFIECCLSAASKNKMNSIAFPALGTGKLGYPAEVVAKVMFHCIHGYLKQNENSSIESVDIVIYPKDGEVYQAFQSVQNNDQTGNHDTTYHHRDNTGSGNRDYGYRNRQHTNYGHTDRPSADDAPSGNHKAKVGHLMVTIVTGDITKETSHVIVNSTMERMDLSKGAVSKAILKAAGQKIQDECHQQAGRLATENLVVTSGGNLQCKCIFHVRSQKEMDGWEKVVSKCLIEADRRSFKSVSFPALGTGAQGCSPDDVAMAMFKAMKKFSSPEPHHLKYVRIVVYQKVMVGRFIEILDQSKGYLSKRKESEKSGQGTKNATNVHEKDLQDVRGHANRSKGQGHPRKQNGVKFMLHSDSNDNIRRAKKKIEESYNSEFSDQHIGGAFKDVIREISDKQLSEVEKISKSHDVTINVNKYKGELEIKGHKNKVLECQSRITEYLHSEEKKKIDHETAKSISQYVQWHYEDNKKMKPFRPDVNYQIEVAYQKKDKSCQVKDRTGVTYFVDFNKMEEYIVSQPGIKFRIERRDTGHHATTGGATLPRTWSQMKTDENFKIVTLHTSDREYEKVKAEFTKSSQASNTIVKIDRIQNKSLYQQYAAKRSELKVKNKSYPEKWLWHGTSPDTLSKVNHNGFNRSYCGKNGTAYGQGVYFAVNASYSLGYCQADSKGQCHMYSAQVLTGDSCRGNSGMRVLPPKGSSSHDTYDSASDNPSNPQMYIIFHDSQAYPTYHITFK